MRVLSAGCLAIAIVGLYLAIIGPTAADHVAGAAFCVVAGAASLGLFRLRRL